MGDPSQAFQGLSANLNQLTENRRRDRRSLADIGLQRTRLDNQSKDIENQQAVKLAQMEREQWLDNPDTIGGILNSTKWDDKKKAQVLQSFPEQHRDKILNTVTTRRQLFDAIKNAQNDIRKEAADKATTDYRNKVLEINRIRAQAAADKSGTPNTAEQKYKDTIATKNLMGKYGLSEDPVTGQVTSQPMTQEQAAQMRAEANRLGLEVYFDQGQQVDKGSGWNPFDNKTVDVFTVRAIAPTGGVQSVQQAPAGTLANSVQQGQQSQQPTNLKSQQGGNKSDFEGLLARAQQGGQQAAQPETNDTANINAGNTEVVQDNASPFTDIRLDERGNLYGKRNGQEMLIISRKKKGGLVPGMVGEMRPKMDEGAESGAFKKYVDLLKRTGKYEEAKEKGLVD